MLKNLLALFIFPATCIAQNVGVGISPTKARLEINGAVGRTNAIFGGDGAGISLQSNNPAIGFNQYFGDVSRSMSAGGGWVQWLDMNTGSLNMDVYPQSSSPNANLFTPTRRLTIQQNGNVAINAGETDASLYVGSFNGSPSSAIFRGTQYNSIINESSFAPGQTNRNTYINGGKAGSLVLLNDKPGGSVLIGSGSTKVGININPTDVLEVKQVGGRGLAIINSNFAYWEIFVEKNLVEDSSDMYVYYKGNNLGNFYTVDGKYYNYSDRRLKTNIRVMSQLLEGVMALKPCNFQMKYNNPGDLKSMGFIAQEVKEIFPSLIRHSEGEDLGHGGMTDLYSMHYDGLGPIAIGAIKEQQQHIAQLQAQINLLHQRINTAEQRLKNSKQPISVNNKKQSL